MSWDTTDGVEYGSHPAEKQDPAEQKILSDRVESIYFLVDLSMQTVKRIYMGLRPGMLDHLGLTAAIAWQADEFSRRTALRATYPSTRKIWLSIRI